MSLNLLDIVKGQLGGAVMDQVSSFLGENPANTATAVNAALPTVLSGLMNQASTTQGASGLLDMLKSGGHDGGIFENLSGLLGGGGSGMSSLLGGGGTILKMLLGDKVGGVADMIGSIAGVKSSSASSLLSMAAPLLMGALGKHVGSTGLGVSGLANLLMGQKDAVQAAMPSGLSSLLGFAGLGDFKGAATAAATTAANTVTTAATTSARETVAAVEEASSGFGRLLPWILGALGLLGALWYLKGCGDKVPVIDPKVALAKAKAKADSLAAWTTAHATAAVEGMKKMTVGGKELSFNTGSIEDQLITFISDKAAAIDKKKWFNFEGLNFDTGKSTLKAGSEAKLANVAAIMAAYPAVTIKVGGYTDNVGKPESNKSLSDARAKTVVAELVKLGVAAARMEGEGYGPENPVADNATDEGKAKNRRIDISVRTK
jgi:outer membrane protein OmpA-like peptidoglycan-associated protein